MTDRSNRHPMTHILAYASVGMPTAAVGLPMIVFVAPMYAEEIGLGTGLVGIIFMMLRFWGLATDPIIGWLIDTKPTQRGRIKHWLLASVPILMLATIFIYMPQGETVSPLYLIFWLAVFWLGVTLLQTPHQSWVALISNEYDERSRFFMWREIVTTISLLALLICPAVLANILELDRRQTVVLMGVVLLTLLPLTIALAVFVVPDAPPKPDELRTRLDWSSIRSTFANPAITRIVLIEIFIGLAIAGTGATFLFTAKLGFGVIETAPAILAVFFFSGFVAMPFWMWLSRRTEKHVALMYVCLWSGVSYLLFIPLSASGTGASGLLLGAVVSGLGYGAPSILLRSMMSDVIAQTQAESGEVRAGLYFSIKSGAFKVGAALAIGIPYILLEWLVGFDVTGDNGPSVAKGVVYVFVGVPLVSYVIAAFVTVNYPITRAAQAETAAKLAPSKG